MSTFKRFCDKGGIKKCHLVNRNNVCKRASALFLWHNRRKEKALQKESAVRGVSLSAESDQGSAFGNRKPLKRLEPNFKTGERRLLAENAVL